MTSGVQNINRSWPEWVPVVAGGALLITGIVVAILGGMQILGDRIAGMAAGGSGAAVGLVVIIIGLVKRGSSATQEQLQQVQWHCNQGLSRKRLAGVYVSDNELCLGKWKDYHPQPHEKLILVVTPNGYSDLFWVDESGDTMEIIQKYQTGMGERFLVLFDLLGVDKDCKGLFDDLPRHMIGYPKWKAFLEGSQWFSTNESDWRRRLDTFIAR